jgi:hypothetical protein
MHDGRAAESIRGTAKLQTQSCFVYGLTEEEEAAAGDEEQTI